MERYSRNRIYISEEEQERIKQVRILLGGAGIGSIIAECALRFGFENITIVDGDKVEESNLNRQNYVHSDLPFGYREVQGGSTQQEIAENQPEG